MNVVDSSGWLEYFADGPNAAEFAKPIEATRSLLVPTLSLFEVFKRVYAAASSQDLAPPNHSAVDLRNAGLHPRRRLRSGSVMTMANASPAANACSLYLPRTAVPF